MLFLQLYTFSGNLLDKALRKERGKEQQRPGEEGWREQGRVGVRKGERVGDRERKRISEGDWGGLYF